jgi:photosystem II stability/assembly factor-like uncharacterized protein
VPSPSASINQNAIFPNPPSVNFPGIRFMDAVDANVVWVIGQDLAAPRRNYNWYSRSINGGTSFAGGNIFADTNTYALSNMEAIDANTAWVCSYMKGSQSQGAIHRTTNGGTNWANMTATGMYANVASFANIVSFFTPSIGVTLGDPINGEYEIWRTTNGGLSWSQIPGQNIDNPLSANEYGIVDLYYRIGTNHMWFGTNQGRIYRTVDAGITWSAAVVGSASSVLIDIAFSSPLEGMCSVRDNNAWELWHTFDGGVTWAQITTIDPNYGFADIQAVPGTNVIISVGIGGGNELISSTIDNGVTWTNWGSTGIPYNTLSFVDGSTGWFGSLNFQSFTNVWKYNGTTITGTTSPNAAFSIPSDLCLSGPTASIVPVNTSSGTPMPTYSWTSSPAGAVFSSPTASAPTITFGTGNTYTITLIATSSSGTNVSTQIISVAPCVAPVASFTAPTSACTSFSFSVNNTSAGAPTPAYFWSISPSGNVTISPSAIASNPVFQVSSATAYTITLVASNASGTASASQVVNVAPCPPTVSFSIPNAIAFCDVKTFTTVNQTTNPPGTSGAINYTWTVFPNTGLNIFPNFFAQNLSVTISDISIPSYTVTLRARNASGTSTITQVIDIEDCTNINENTLSNAIAIFPNPVKDQVNISLPSSNEAYAIKITNVLGSVIYQSTTAKELTKINLGNNAKGVYFVTIESNTEKITRKIVLD